MLHSPLHKVTWPVKLLMQEHPNVLCSAKFTNSSDSNLQTALWRGGVWRGGGGCFSPLPFLSSLILVMDRSQMNNIWQLAHPLPGWDLPLSSECLPLCLNGWLSERIKWCLKKHTDIVIKGTPTLTGSWEWSLELQLSMQKRVVGTHVCSYIPCVSPADLSPGAFYTPVLAINCLFVCSISAAIQPSTAIRNTLHI